MYWTKILLHSNDKKIEKLEENFSSFIFDDFWKNEIMFLSHWLKR